MIINLCALEYYISIQGDKGRIVFNYGIFKEFRGDRFRD